MRVPHSRRRLLTSVAVAVPLFALGVVAAGPASAHVVVTSPDAVPGGYGTLAFRVPTESASAKTVKVTVTLPADAPFGDVSARTLTGWTVATTDRKLAQPVTTDDGFTLDKAVGTITWTAADGGIPPGQFQEFDLSVGPFPDRAGQKLTFGVDQAYSDGSVVHWNQPAQAGKPEPDHPAPTLTVGASTATEAAASSPQPSVAAVAARDAGATGATDTTRYVAIGALAVAVLGLILAAAALVRSGSR
jgi:periplasmic copper chaperone A